MSYKFNPFTGALDLVGASGGPSPSGTRQVELFTLNAQNILDKKITLSTLPTSQELVVVASPNGPVQNLNDDFIVSGLDISWDGYGLETILEIGDKLIVTYS